LVALVVGLVVLAALGAVGYFVVLPMLQQAP
jgi:preprotein translocase subunit Sss1